MGLQYNIKAIFFLAIFGLHYHHLPLVNAGIIPPVSGQLGANKDLLNKPLNQNLGYSESESGESKLSKPVRTDLPDAAEYPRYNPNGTDERRDEDGRTGADRSGGRDRNSYFTTLYPTYTRLGEPLTWGPTWRPRLPPTTIRQTPPPRPPRTTVNNKPRVGKPITIISGRLPAQLGSLNSLKYKINSSIRGESNSDVGLIAGIFMGIFMIVVILIAVNIQCIKARLRRYQPQY